MEQPELFKRKIGRPLSRKITLKEYNKQYYKENKSRMVKDLYCEECKIVYLSSNHNQHTNSKCHLQNCLKNL